MRRERASGTACRTCSIVLLAAIFSAASEGGQNAWTRKIDVGRGPNFIRVSPDGLYAAVSCFASGEIDLIDLREWKKVRHAKAGNGCLGLAFSSDGGTLYSGNMETGVVRAYSFPDLRPVDSIKVGNIPTDMALTPDGYLLAVANFGKGKTGRVDFVDLPKKRVTESVDVGFKPVAIAVSHAGDKVFVANSAGKNVTVVSPEIFRVLETIPVGDGPDGIAVSRNGRKLFVAHSRSNDLWVYDLRRKSLLRKYDLPGGPFRVSLSPDEARAAVACYQSASVAIVSDDGAVADAVRVLAVPKKPVDAVFTPDGRNLLVVCEGADCVVVVPVGP